MNDNGCCIMDEIMNIVGYSYNNPDLLRIALTHSSVTRDSGARMHSYQRLEFLGDRVLSLVIAEMLYKKFPQYSEGDLTMHSARLIKRDTVAMIACDMGIAKYIRTTPDGMIINESILCDVMEALIGSIYIDGNLTTAYAFIQHHWHRHIDIVDLPNKDAKSLLQEWSQKYFKIIPEYRILDVSGSAHEPTFTVSVTAGPLTSTATGCSKREAQMRAACQCLDMIPS